MQRLKKTSSLSPSLLLARAPFFANLPIVGLFLLCCLAEAPLNAETRHIHVLKILDDNSSNLTIREGCRSIDYGIDQEVQLMKYHLGITDVHYYPISGTNFSLARLQDVLDYELAYQERDIILLVYAGHGFREPSSNSRFPKLYFNSYSESVEFEEIRWQLIEKNPSMLINMVIACNTTQLDRNQPPPYVEGGNPPPFASLTPKGIRKTEPYHRMFADQSGHTKVIDFVSADRENLTFMSRDGSIFFNEILFGLQEVFIDKLFSDWTALCQHIDQRTVARSQANLLDQKPFSAYQIVISQGAVVRAETTTAASQCLETAKNLRKRQKEELKALRQQHRIEVRNLAADQQENRRLITFRQRREKADLRLQHEQNYRRSLANCR